MTTYRILFGCIIFATACIIASIAAYFSVYGLAHIFAGAFMSVVIMGAGLEFGKLIATSFLYRYWTDIGIWLRSYLIAAIVGLMVITSAGIFGYLSNAYQQDMKDVRVIELQLAAIDDQLAIQQQRLDQIQSDIARVGDNYVTARRQLMADYAAERATINQTIVALQTERIDVQSKQVETEAHTGPIIYIAKSLNKTVDDAVLWMIGLIIIVFDPLAIALTIGANVVWTTRSNGDKDPVIPDQCLEDPSDTVHDGQDEPTALNEAPMAEVIATMANEVADLEDANLRLAEKLKEQQVFIDQIRNSVTSDGKGNWIVNPS